jgi:hypothetical protein
VSVQQVKHIADTPVRSMEGNLTAGRSRRSTGTETCPHDATLKYSTVQFKTKGANYTLLGQCAEDL